jgi:CHASE2 domain-containing sensor protein
LATLAYHTHLLRRPEQLTVDARFQVRGAEPRLAKDLIAVGIDERTLADFRRQHLRTRSPLPRRYLARVIERLRRAGAKVIALDLDLADRDTPANDAILARAITRTPRIVLGTSDVGPFRQVVTPNGDRIVPGVGAHLATMAFLEDTDGVLRRTQWSIDGVQTLGVAIARVAAGRAVQPSLLGGQNAPIPIDFAGPPDTVPEISYSRVYNGRFPASAVRGKIVVVGATASRFQDVHQTATSASSFMPGPEIVANEAATVLNGVPLRNAPEWVTLLLIAFLALVPCLAGLRLSTLGVALTALTVLAGWTLATQLAFNSDTQVDYAAPAFSLIVATGGAMLVGLWADSRERKRLRELFAAEAPAVVQRVLHPSGSGALDPTAIIAGYRIEEVIGRGGMGVVYRASQVALDRPVALKLIATERAQDPAFRERFKLESRLAASIEHVNVIPLYEAGEDDGLLFITMRLVEGNELAHLIKYGPLEPARTARLMAQLGGALDAAHAHGLVHRDVKPANVLLTLDQPEHLYLTDFGLAKTIGVGDGMTQAGQWVGTLDYVAPEQIRGEAVSASVDIYAMAGVLYHCLTGQVAFDRDHEAAKLWAHLGAPPPAPTTLRSDLPDAIDEVIARGMAKDPRDRYATAAELADACARALGVDLIASTTPDPSPGVGRAAGEWPPTAIAED